MASIPAQYRATLYDLANKRSFEVFLDGDLSRSDRQVGGGPIIPPPSSGGGGGGGPVDPGWGYPEHPVDPGWGVPERPVDPGYFPPRPAHPIVLPPDQVPPGMKPPETPPPGTVTPVPPPEGQTGWPVQPIVPPEYVVLNYPGVGPVYVGKPASAGQPTPTPARR